MLYRDLPPGNGAEVGTELDQPVTIDGRIAWSVLPGGEVAWSLHRGPYHLLGEAHDAVAQRCAALGRAPAGIRWEIYGHHHDDPAKLETEVYWLLA